MLFFFFKQKTAYEMRISDWSSDVCSSDLKLMRGTMADPLTAPEAARMAESIRALFNVNAKALKLLPAKGPRFSVRDWIRGSSQSGSILFLSARYVDMSICSQLLTLWLDTAMNTLMTMERTPDPRVRFLIEGRKSSV